MQVKPLNYRLKLMNQFLNLNLKNILSFQLDVYSFLYQNDHQSMDYVSNLQELFPLI